MHHLLVAVLDVRAAQQQQLDEVLVAARAGQRERRVVVGVGLAVHVHGAVGGRRGLRRRGRAVRLAGPAAAPRPREPPLHHTTRIISTLVFRDTNLTSS